MVIPSQFPPKDKSSLRSSVGPSLRARIPAVPRRPPLRSPKCSLLTLNRKPARPLIEKLIKTHLFIIQTPPRCTPSPRRPSQAFSHPVGEPYIPTVHVITLRADTSTLGPRKVPCLISLILPLVIVLLTPSAQIRVHRM